MGIFRFRIRIYTGEKYLLLLCTNVLVIRHLASCLKFCGGARRLNQAADWSMAVSYEDVRRHLGLPSLEEAEAKEH